jgi:hypothetical protein
MMNTGIPEEELEKFLDLPFDEKETRFIQPVALKHLKFVDKAIKELKEETREDLAGLRVDLQKNVNTAFRIILGNLIFCTFERKGLTIPGDHKAYNKGGHLRSLFLTKRAVDMVLASFIKHKYISKKKGSEAAKKANSYKPLTKLQRIAIPLIYEIQEEYEETQEVVIFNNKEQSKGYKNNDVRTRGRTSNQIDITQRLFFKKSLEESHPDVRDLRRINRVLKRCTYPLKSPVTRIFSYGDPMRGGRLYTRLQNLPDRRARIRINTLFNGEPVAEVDLSANHPRMIMAMTAKKTLSATFYEDIAKATKTTRDQVKFFFTKALGAGDRRISLKEDDSKGWDRGKPVMTVVERRRLESHIKDKYPEISDYLYKGAGIYLQGLEGNILLRTMIKLLNQGIPSLPIHDAVYVQRRFASQARDAIETAWQEEFEVDFRPITKIDHA